MKHIIMFVWAFVLLVGCGLLAANPLLGIVVIIIAILGAGSQVRRQQNATEERRHQEILQAMKEGQPYDNKEKNK